MRFLVPQWRSNPAPGFYEEFLDGLEAAIAELGHQSERFVFAERGTVGENEAQALFQTLQSSRFHAVIDLACWGFALSRLVVSDASGNSESLFDALGIPYVQWLLDQPCFQQMLTVMANRHHALYPDRGHSAQALLLYPGLRLTSQHFAPPAVNQTKASHLAQHASARDIDVLYIGNLFPEALSRVWNHQVDPRWPSDFRADLCNAMADGVLEQPDRPLHLIARDAVIRLGPFDERFNLRVHYAEVEHFFRHSVRHDAVLTLARSGVRMTVIGSGWEQMALPDNVTVTRQTDYDGLFRFAARAKICLDASSYLDGANDRVFSYASQAAVCFTNAHGYLSEVFPQNAGVHYYSPKRPQQFLEEVRALLSKPQQLMEQGRHAAAVVMREHTWRQRLSATLAALRLEE